MADTTARAVGTVGVWAGFAVAMAFGLCRMNFSNAAGAFLFAFVVLCGTAVIATWLVWRVPRARGAEFGPRGFPVVDPQ